MDASSFWARRSGRFASIAREEGSFYAERSALVAQMLRMLRCEGRTLDVGCGTGQLCMELARSGFEVYGIDFSEDQIACAIQRSIGVIENSRERFCVGDAEHIPFDGKFDVITAIGVLPYIANHPEFVRHLATRLAPSGIIVLSITRRTSLFTVVALWNHIRSLQFSRSWLWVLTNLLQTGVWSGGFVDRRNANQCRAAATLDHLCGSLNLVREGTLDLYNVGRWDFAGRPFSRGRFARLVARWCAWSHIALYRAVRCDA